MDIATAKSAEPLARLRFTAPPDQALESGRFIPIPGGFRLWSQGTLRSSGFPLSGLLELADTEYAAAADRWLDEPGDATRQVLDGAASRAATRQAELLSRIARRADFQEAVSWQNPDLVEPMIITLGRMGPGAPNNQRLRKRQRIVAKYWARYCAKNETIGFFGPASWFDLRADGEPLRMEPGPALVRRGGLFLEPWAIDALAAALSNDPEVRPWVAPRLHPTVYLSGNRARTFGGQVELDEGEARLLALVDGHRIPADIAAGCGTEPAQVHQALNQLAARGLVIWDLEPPMIQHAERELRERLEAIGDATVRDRATGQLDRLEAARDALANYGDADDLRRRNERLEREFTRLTGVDPARRPGQTYGGRRLTYVECARDLTLSFGPQLLQSCAEPLALLLISARWFVHELAQRTRAVLLAAFDAMGVEAVDFTKLGFSCADKIFIPGNRVVDDMIREFAASWRAILGLDTDAREVRHASDALRGQVEDSFGAAYPNWKSAQIHSVDLLIAARDADAFARGEFQPVIGELHMSYCPFEIPFCSWAHPDIDELRTMLATIVPDGRVMLSPAKNYPRTTARTYPFHNDARTWWLCTSPYPPRGAGRHIAQAGLVARRDGDRLVAGLPGAAEQFDVMDITGAWLMWELLDVFKQVASGHEHTPRTVVDNVVVFRETWQFPIADLDWAYTRGEAELFVAARRWLRDRGLPETVFASISSEPKPVFADFRSEVQVAILAQLLRAGAKAAEASTAGANPAGTKTAGASVAFSEMLPGPGQSWLTDAAGQPYTCELRLVFADGQ
jgi:hypothetical protein